MQISGAGYGDAKEHFMVISAGYGACGGGGGATDIRLNGTGIGNIVLMAGAGGGVGQTSEGFENGGDGG